MVRDDAAEERKQKIVEAAFKVFSEKGYKGATNKMIAEEAGITPGLIYWYFRDKEDLFNAVFEAKTPAISLRKLRDESRDMPPEVFFSQVARVLLKFWLNPQFTGLFRLMVSEISRFPSIGKLITNKLTSAVHDVVIAYIQEQIDAGRFKPVDPLVAAQVFLGSLVSFMLLGRILQSDRIAAIPADTIVDHVVPIFLGGIQREE